MRRLRTLLGQPEFHGFLFCLCLILFSYPLLLMSNGSLAGTIYLSLFLPWGGVIILLFLTTRSYPVTPPDKSQGREDGDVTDA